MNQQDEKPAASAFSKASSYNNADKPVVMLYLGSERNITRGDVHGYKGIARRVSEMMGTSLVTFDAATLEGLYPSLKKPHERAIAFLSDKGMPDILFAHETLPIEADDFMKANAIGCKVMSLNENIRGSVMSFNRAANEAIPYDLVPHDLTPADLAYEGQRFAEEYGELPRPFIAVNLVDIGPGEARSLAMKLASAKDAYERATYFVCSCHRTLQETYDVFVRELSHLTGYESGRYPVVAYNFTQQAETEGVGMVWNPYKGLLSQADHVVIAGYSYSMLSETIAAGKTPYLYGTVASQVLLEKKWAMQLGHHTKGAPFATRRIDNPPDISAMIAQNLVDILQDVRGGKSKFHGAPSMTGYLEL